jgi:signal transduction histidine kinase/ActR/RegA family two-component response regulator
MARTREGVATSPRSIGGGVEAGEKDARTPSERLRAVLAHYGLAVRDASAPAAFALGLHYAALAPIHWLGRPGPIGRDVAVLAALTSAVLFALAARWVRKPPTPDYFGTWFAALVTLNNVHLVWRDGMPEDATGFYLMQLGLGFAGLSSARFWALTALGWAGFLPAPALAGFSSSWMQVSFAMGAALVLSFMIQSVRLRYGQRLERATVESERQRAAAELNLARFREEEAHRARLQERLAHAERLESLGLLAGGVAHDFNNLLAVVIGHASLAQGRAGGAELRGDLEAIVDAAERAALLSRELLAYAGRSAKMVSPIDFAREVAGVCALAQSSLPPRVTLRTTGIGGGAIVRADRGQLQQIVLNLLMNAGDATAEYSGHIDVSTGRKWLAAEVASALEPPLGRPAGHYCFVRVADDGAGMSAETLRHVFDPFFTTKQSGRGLGLAAALGIARAHGGGFRVKSERGIGSEFVLYVPETDEPALRAEPSPPSLRVARQRPLVLVVDDKDDVRRMVARALDSAGFRSVAVSSGREAVDVLLSRADEVAAAVVDMSMPEMDGEQTLRALRAIRSDLPVLLSSGFDAHEAAARLVAQPGVAFLAKPYRVAQIQELLGELIEGAARAAV